MALISPWGVFAIDSDSYKRNAYKDTVSGLHLEQYAKYFMGDAKIDAYNQPFTAEKDWWKGIEKVATDIVITGGTEEVLIDGIKEFSDKLKVLTLWNN